MFRIMILCCVLFWSPASAADYFGPLIDHNAADRAFCERITWQSYRGYGYRNATSENIAIGIAECRDVLIHKGTDAYFLNSLSIIWEYQRQHGLPLSGRLDRRTAALLNRFKKPQIAVQPPAAKQPAPKETAPKGSPDTRRTAAAGKGWIDLESAYAITVIVFPVGLLLILLYLAVSVLVPFSKRTAAKS
jgi:hypothetical protein